MKGEKRTISIQFSKDGSRRDQVDKHKVKKKKPETEWVFPEPDHVVETKQAKQPEKVEEREIYYWNERKQTAPISAHSQKKKPRTFLKNGLTIPWMLIGSVASAILIGVSLGFVLLTVSTGDKNYVTNEPAIEAGTTPVATVDEEQKQQATANELFVIQGGAFSTKEAGSEVSNKLKQEGYAATIESGADTDLLYIGAAGSKEQALQLAEMYEKAGHEVYVKNYSVDEVQIDGEQKQTAEWFQKAGQHLTEVAEVSAFSLADSSPEKEDLDVLTTHLTQLENQRETDMEQATEEMKASAQTLMAKLAESNQLLAADSDDKWTAQQIILDAMLVYKKSMRDLSEM
ncbi:SPOR domain-containing protein [Alkalicoccobacillus plakortidis]|uniref:SPOR domain-containing protein n=1 Tax=Alkalicoccobacillus plakortidis TaxID=444060 RepID=A0ABT0XGX8_9BACI|nr:SPOR domain-containing protein [Alkalicoccobacillus plakortidis]MCM2675170.1 SPOR domain-containing protein [Alkalicoccobacillus plakortidis]